MNLHTWRTTPALTSAAAKVRADATYTQMVSLARDHIQHIASLPRTGNSPEDMSYNYGMIIGYWHGLAVLDALAEPQTEQAMPEASFADENDQNPQPQA